MLAQMVKSATLYAVGVPRARLRPHASPCALDISQAFAGRADDLRPPRDPFASGSVTALYVRTLLSRRRSRGP
eukprot:3765162-Prymnesium_polylepis.1